MGSRRLTVEEIGGSDRRADGFTAARLLMAMIDEDFAETDRILLETPIVPLLTGLAGVAVALGQQATGDDTEKLQSLLDALALSLADPDAGEAAGRGWVAP